MILDWQYFIFLCPAADGWAREKVLQVTSTIYFNYLIVSYDIQFREVG